MPKIDVYQGSFLVFVFLLLGSFLIMLPTLSTVGLSFLDFRKGILSSLQIPIELSYVWGGTFLSLAIVIVIMNNRKKIMKVMKVFK